MTSIKNLVERGLPNNPPTAGPRKSGLGNLRETSPPASAQAQRAAKGAIPGADEGVIRGMEQAGQEGVQAGAEGEAPKHPAGSQPGNLPPGIAGLIAPDGFHVP